VPVMNQVLVMEASLQPPQECGLLEVSRLIHGTIRAIWHGSVKMTHE
jgi:hypothetical protein